MGEYVKILIVRRRSGTADRLYARDRLHSL